MLDNTQDYQENSQQDVTQQQKYDFLVEECDKMLEQIDDLMVNQPLINQHELYPGKQTLNLENDLNINFQNKKIIEKKIEINEKDKFQENELLKEQLYEEKKQLEDNFLEINMDIQKKKKSLASFTDLLKNSQQEIEKVESKIREKAEFIVFLEEQLDQLKVKNTNSIIQQVQNIEL